jgi:hypothetical protein
MAAQKAVEELSAKGLLEEPGIEAQVEGMKQAANNHQKKIEQLVENLSKSECLNSQSVQESAIVIHYEALNTMAQGITDTVQSILEEEKKNLMQCIQVRIQTMG